MTDKQARILGAKALRDRAHDVFGVVGREPGRFNWRGQFIPKDKDNLEMYRAQARQLEEAAAILEGDV